MRFLWLPLLLLLALAMACGGSRSSPPKSLGPEGPPVDTRKHCATSRLESQCRAVAHKLNAWRQGHHGGEAILLLGAPPDGDLQRFRRPGTFVVLLDQQESSRGPAPDLGETLANLTADFNALADLDLIAGHLASAFNQVAFDSNVVYFTRWSQAHLERIGQLLAPEGTFLATAMWHGTRFGHPMPPGLRLEGDTRQVLETAAEVLTRVSSSDSLLPGEMLLVPNRLMAYIYERGLQDEWRRIRRARLQEQVTGNLRTCFGTVVVRSECPWYVEGGEAWTLYVCRR